MSSFPQADPIFVTACRFTDTGNETDPLNRQSLVENRHWGWLVIHHRSDGLLYSTPGATKIATFFRSSAKPFQAFPLVESGLYRQLTEPELALTCASHTGSQQHVELAHGILQKAGLSEDSLQCGPHTPADMAMQEHLRQHEKAPTALHNNCSGKHAGMLLYCAEKGLDTATYLDKNHPLQQDIIQCLRDWGGLETIPTAIDGCGAPVFYLPLTTMALLYAHLGSSEPFSLLCNAMSKHPEIVGGEGRVDTVLMQVSEGALLAKVGADGVLCVSRVGTGEGLALKIADGNELVRNMATVEALIRLGWINEKAACDARLSPFRNQLRFNTQNKAVGAYQIHFPLQSS